MDTLSFERSTIKFEHGNGQMHVCASVIINGISLIEIVRTYELPYAAKYEQENIAGGYIPNASENLYSLLVEKRKSPEYQHEIPILICECGCEGCWDLLVTIDEDELEVLWSNIHNPHRSYPMSEGGFWDYKEFPSFRFDKKQYKDAIETLAKML
jgi:hypothetical protein